MKTIKEWPSSVRKEKGRIAKRELTLLGPKCFGEGEGEDPALDSVGEAEGEKLGVLGVELAGDGTLKLYFTPNEAGREFVRGTGGLMAKSWEPVRDPSLERRLGVPMSCRRGDSLEASWSGDSVSEESAELLINGGSSSSESYELAPTPLSCPPRG
jgi:hypothetical protein